MAVNQEAKVSDRATRTDVAAMDVLAQSMPTTLYRCLLDEHWTMLSMTAGVEALTGYPAEAFIRNGRMSFASVVHPDDAASVQETVRAAVARQEPFVLQFRVLTRDGDVKSVRGEGHALFNEDGTVRWIDGFILDMSELRSFREAEDSRRAAMEQQQAALVSLATAQSVALGKVAQVAQLATELVVSAANVERASVWLLSEDTERLELVDLYQRTTRQHNSDVTLTSGDYPAYFATLRTGRLIDAHDARTDPRTNEFADGYLKPLGITSMLDAALRVGGQVVGVLCIEHVGDARTWRDHEIHFAGEVADQVSHALLNRARIDAQNAKDAIQEQLFRSQKMEAMGRLAGGVAHDFNNLLTVISGHAEMIQIHLGDHPASEDAKTITLTAERAGELTQQLLAFARKETMSLAEVDLATAVSDMEKMLARTLDDDISLRISMGATRLPVRATLGLLQQILTNLVVNARDAMPGGGQISVGVEEVELKPDDVVKLPDLATGPHVVMTVSDTGSGMPAEVLENVFEPFFTTKAPGKGTGLGLSTVYGIVRQCGGTISVQSEVGMGTTFIVYFPRSDTSSLRQSSHAPALDTTEAFGAGRTVVVAEDNDGVRDLVSRILTQAGFEVIDAHDTNEALRILRSIQRQAANEEAYPSLIISDVMMPGGGGVEVLNWVKKCMPMVPMTFISGYVDERAAQVASTIPRLAKPFSSVQLLAHVRRLLSKPAI